MQGRHLFMKRIKLGSNQFKQNKKYFYRLHKKKLSNLSRKLVRKVVFKKLLNIL